MKDFSRRPPFTRSSAEVATDIDAFARLHHLHIQPGKTPESWAEIVVRMKGCPCEPERLNCPCADALDDIEQEGTCRCNLFANDNFMELLKNFRLPGA